MRVVAGVEMTESAWSVLPTDLREEYVRQDLFEMTEGKSSAEILAECMEHRPREESAAWHDYVRALVAHVAKNTVSK